MKLLSEHAVRWLIKPDSLAKRIRSALDRSIIYDEASGIVRLDMTQAQSIIDVEENKLQGVISEIWGEEKK